MNFKPTSIWISLLLFLIFQACNSLTENQSPSTSNNAVTPNIQQTKSPTASPRSQTLTTKNPDADVVFVKAVEKQDGTWTFHVTIKHPDTGWNDYTDGWNIILPDGTILKPDQESAFTRLLLHPHINEQPFTRSQSKIEIPEGTAEVKVKAHDIVDGFGGQEVIVDLTKKSGENFKVERYDR